MVFINVSDVVRKMDEVAVKKVLYLSYDGMTDPLGQSQVLPYLAGLTKRGYQFTLISFEKEERFIKNKSIIEKICSDNNINWHPLPYTSKPPIFSTIKDLRKLKSQVKKLHTTTHFDIVHCRSYITALAGLWMKKKWDVKFIFDMRGFWADERVDGNIWKLSNPLFKLVYTFFKKKERVFLSKADYTISLTNNAEKVIHSWKEIENQPIPIKVIPCCVDMDLFNPSLINEESVKHLRNKLTIPDGAKVITYIGSIGTWYMLPEMLAFFKRWLLKNPASVFLFVTNDSSATINDAANKAGMPLSAIRIQSAARTEVPLYISLGDYSIFFIKPVFSKKASSPTKQGEIMAMGKPVICNSEVGDTDYVVNSFNSGILIDKFEDTVYDKAIDALKNDIQFNVSVIREGALQFFSLQEGINRYQEVYKSVLGES